LTLEKFSESLYFNESEKFKVTVIATGKNGDYVQKKVIFRFLDDVRKSGICEFMRWT